MPDIAMDFVTSVLQQTAKVIPVTGYNLVRVDAFATDPEELLSLVAHFDTLAAAQSAKAIYEDSEPTSEFHIYSAPEAVATATEANDIWIRNCITKNIRAGMEKDQAILTCRGSTSKVVGQPQVSTKRTGWRTVPDAMHSVPGSAGGEFNSGFGVTFGPTGQPISYGGQAPTGQGVGTGNPTGAGAMMAHKASSIRPLLVELSAILHPVV